MSLQRRAFTADEFERMAEAGVFSQDERVELLDGAAVKLSPISPTRPGASDASCGCSPRSASAPS